MYKINILTLLIFFLFISESYSQAVTGTVRDAQSRELLPGASVMQTGTDAGTITNENGRFTLQLNEDLSLSITVRFLGYRVETIQLSRANLENISISLISEAIISENILIQAHRVDENAPVTYSNVSRDQIEDRNLGKDIPFLLQSTPSVISTSDAGHGVGYTGFRVRGVDPQRINVTVNGIPLNDSESHGVFWVNMPDFASSTENIQIQRGVGTSTHGPAAFGASINLQTTTLNRNPYGRVQSSAGSFNTFRNTLQVGTGLLENGWSFDGRYSKITSDGFVDRAFSDLQSMFLSATRHGDRSLLKINVFTGEEQTYQSWYGISEDKLTDDRTWNFYEYDNQTDNYQQDHYQLHHTYRLADSWYLNASLHYTYGRGYFEEFRPSDRFNRYGFDPIEIGGEVIDRSDIIRRRWLDNHFYGAVLSSDFTTDDERLRVSAGGGIHIYTGDHFGEVIWARFAGEQNIRERYYDNVGEKTDFNMYAKADYYITNDLSAFVDLQIRTIAYDLTGIDRNRQEIDQSHNLSFFNPKAGLVYRLNEQHRVYASYSVGSKEPTRRDYTDAVRGTTPEAERLFNWEAGYRGQLDRVRLGLNFYYMDYENQLIPTGDINDVGSPIRTNVAESYRAGIEAEATVAIADWVSWSGNTTLSRNKVAEFTEVLVNYDTGNLVETLYTDSDIAYAPSFMANSMFRFTWGDFTADLTSLYVGRQFLDNTQTERRSLNPYFVNDLSLDYHIRGISYLNELRVGITIYNLLDEMYESNGYSFGYIWGGETIYENWYYPQAGRHFMARIVLGF